MGNIQHPVEYDKGFYDGYRKGTESGIKLVADVISTAMRPTPIVIRMEKSIMQAEDQDNLIHDLVEDLDIQRSLKNILHQADKEGKLFRLLPDEVALLVAYRNWKANPITAKDVFQWKLGND